MSYWYGFHSGLAKSSQFEISNSFLDEGNPTIILMGQTNYTESN